jgi:hypothetical protein
MEKLINHGGGRSLRSTLGKFLSVGASMALLATGALLVTASPAGAAGAPSQIVYTVAPPADATLSVALSSFSVSVEDNTSTVITSGTGATDSITISSSCTLGGTITVTAAAGVATFNALTITAGTSCTLIATDTTSTLTVTSAAVTIVSTTATKLAFGPEPPTTTAAGATLTSFSVKVENAAGQPANNGSADVIAITSSCSLAGTTTATSASGIATFGALVIDGGTSPCTLTATDSTETLATAASTGVTVTAGAATKVAFTTEPPATVVESAVLTTFKVSVEDLYGNVETSGTGDVDTVALTSACTLGGTTTAVAVAGVATFSALTITSTGSCTLTATDSSRALTTAPSTAVDSQGAQTALTVSSLTGYLGSALTLTTAGGSGAGAVTFTAVPGTALGCVVTGTSLAVTSLGTCLVTATKAASLTNLVITSAATTVTFVLPFKATRTNGFVIPGRTTTVTIVGTGFIGRPRITSHAGTTVVVARDTGKLLTVKVTVKAGSRNGTYTFTIKLGNGKTCKVKYVQRA